MSIRWKLTLWYGAALAVILVIVSMASYLRYRAAAWRAFDADLRMNLDTLQSAFLEEFRENAARTLPGDIFSRAATETMDGFRLNGMYGEIRRGRSAETMLARIPGAGIAPGQRFLDESIWRETAGSPETRFTDVGLERRAVLRSVRPPGQSDWATLAVADRTLLVEQTLASIRRALFQIGTAGLLLALVGGAWLATRALRPIDLLTTQAGRMPADHPAGAGGRLRVQNPDDELGRLAATFNRLLERIEASVAQRKAFIADAAHELKTPVSVVRTSAELSLSADRNSEEYREALLAIAGESAHLSRLVSDLTLLAEGETLDHPVERRLVDLNELVHEVTRSLRAVAVSRRITLDVDSSGGVEYRGDERLLRQILKNLIENAIKFSRLGGRVGIVLTNGGSVRQLHVLDEAPTLSEYDRGRVFERFYRAPHARGSDATGSGLGLAIVRWAVTLHGGTIRVEPREPLGNVFVVDFPAATGEAVAGFPESADAPEG